MALDLNNKTKLTIGRLARASGVGISTIRYYQKRGLLRQPERPSLGSVRSYGERDVERLHLIKQAQELGFTLAEISALVTHLDEHNCHAVKTLADKKLQDVVAQIVRLNSIRNTLKAFLAYCAQEDCDQCQIIQKLNGHDSSGLATNEPIGDDS